MPARRYHGAVREAQLELQAPQLHPGNVEEVELLAALLVVVGHRVGFLQGHAPHDGSRGPMQLSVCFALGTMCK